MSRYTPDELEQWIYVPDIADPAAPTVAEIGDGQDFTEAIASVSGFRLSSNRVATPDLGTRFDKSVPGRLSTDDASIAFYKGDSATDLEEVIRNLLPRGTGGYVVRVHPKDGAKAAIAAATKAEVWPIEVMSNSVNPPSPGEAAKFTVAFSHPEKPSEVATIAA